MRHSSDAHIRHLVHHRNVVAAIACVVALGLVAIAITGTDGLYGPFTAQFGDCDDLDDCNILDVECSNRFHQGQYPDIAAGYTCHGPDIDQYSINGYHDCGLPPPNSKHFCVDGSYCRSWQYGNIVGVSSDEDFDQLIEDWGGDVGHYVNCTDNPDYDPDLDADTKYFCNAIYTYCSNSDAITCGALTCNGTCPSGESCELLDYDDDLGTTPCGCVGASASSSSSSQSSSSTDNTGGGTTGGGGIGGTTGGGAGGTDGGDDGGDGGGNGGGGSDGGDCPDGADCLVCLDDNSQPVPCGPSSAPPSSSSSSLRSCPDGDDEEYEQCQLQCGLLENFCVDNCADRHGCELQSIGYSCPDSDAYQMLGSCTTGCRDAQRRCSEQCLCECDASLGTCTVLPTGSSSDAPVSSAGSSPSSPSPSSFSSLSSVASSSSSTGFCPFPGYPNNPPPWLDDPHYLPPEGCYIIQVQDSCDWELVCAPACFSDAMCGTEFCSACFRVGGQFVRSCATPSCVDDACVWTKRYEQCQETCGNLCRADCLQRPSYEWAACFGECECECAPDSPSCVEPSSSLSSSLPSLSSSSLGIGVCCVDGRCALGQCGNPYPSTNACLVECTVTSSASSSVSVSSPGSSQSSPRSSSLSSRSSSPGSSASSSASSTLSASSSSTGDAIGGTDGGGGDTGGTTGTTGGATGGTAGGVIGGTGADGGTGGTAGGTIGGIAGGTAGDTGVGGTAGGIAADTGGAPFVFPPVSSQPSFILIHHPDDTRDADSFSPLPPGLVAAASVCGNGILEPGEECDDGNRVSGDGCSSNCLLEVGICGDGKVQTLLGEQCESSLHDPSLPYDCVNCRYVSPTCGNGTIDPGEECDDGPLNSDTPGANCRTDCSLARCGDGILDPSEECDDGNRVDGDGCSSFCRLETDVAGVQVRRPTVASQLITFPAYQQATQPGITATLQPLIAGTAPVGDTGPAAVAVIGAGAAAGLAWVRRRRP